ncbi:hypothetical protein BDV24DRAFT_124407 [Aspergillus arachidicola]|uniref:Uncharacterized protein n=1 Tax=Aspergillus arachidicola TaxID=656916 RepID=A0A5N6YL35_9EURO|nr:hypothetical protein BDV24DRAFT_124407 [Aspergillus arachidicola]
MRTGERGREEDVVGWILSRPYILVYWSVSIWVCSLFLHPGVGLFLSLFLFFFYAVYGARTWVHGCGTSDWPVGGEWILLMV